MYKDNVADCHCQFDLHTLPGSGIFPILKNSLSLLILCIYIKMNIRLARAIAVW